MKMLVPAIISYLPLAAAALAFVSIVVPSVTRTRARAIWAIALLLAGSRGIVFKGLGNSYFTPNFPEAVVWAWYVASATLFLMLVLRLFWWTKRGRTTVLPALALLLAAWGAWEGFRAPTLKEVTLTVPNLPQELDGYKILQISDIHCSSAARRWRTERIVNMANAAKPDLICLTGDYADGLVSERAHDLEPLLSLVAPDGVWCVMGNHEYYQDGARWRSWERASGLRFLANDCVYPRAHLALAGVNDPIGVSLGPDVAPNVEHAFRTSATNDFRVLLAHRPKDFRENAREWGVDLQLSGHTHGGIAPGLASLVAMLNGGFVRGLYEEGDARLYVSPGAGLWSGFPIRFFNRSEMTLFTLTPRACDLDNRATECRAEKPVQD